MATGVAEQRFGLCVLVLDSGRAGGVVRVFVVRAALGLLLHHRCGNATGQLDTAVGTREMELLACACGH